MRKPTLTIFYQFNPWESSIGGIQTIIRYFIKYAPQDFDIRLVGTEVDPKREVGEWYTSQVEGRELMFFPLLRLQNDDVRQVIPTSLRYTLSLLAKDFSSDFLHFHRLEPALAAFRWSGKKMLFVHNDIHQQIRAKGVTQGILWKRFPQAYFAFERLLIRQFDQVLSCNSESTQLYKEQYPEFADRVSFVRNTFDGDIFYPLSTDMRHDYRQKLAYKLGLSQDTRFLLFAGRLHPQKDPLLLIRAMASLQSENVHLLIAGDGELAPAMREEIAALGLDKKISMLGSLTQSELADLHRVSSAFVLSSAYEGLPLVVLEALACGTPVVTTRAGETPRLLAENSGVVCEERSPQDIASSIQSVLSQPERYSTTACVENASPYSAKTVIHRIYEDMASRWVPK